MLSTALALLAGLLFLYYLYCKKCHSYWAARGIYSPPGNWFLGHILINMNFPVVREVKIDEDYREHPDEKVIGYYEGTKPVLGINDIDLVQRVFIKDFDHFVDRRDFKITNPADDFLKDMLNFTRGSHWKDLRSVLSPTFSSGKMKNMFILIKEKAERVVELCKPHAKSGDIVDFSDISRNYAMDVIGSCAFGLETDTIRGKNEEFTKAAEAVTKPTAQQMLKLFIMGLLPMVAQLFKLQFCNEGHDFFSRVVKRAIQTRENGSVKREDFVDLLLEIKKSPEDADDNDEFVKKKKIKLTERSIMSQTILFLLGGLDTTSNTLNFVLKQLSLYPKYQTLIRDELRKKMADDGRECLIYEDVMESRWPEAFIAETMRMYPPAGTHERVCTKDWTIPGTTTVIPKGTIAFVSAYSLHHDERFFPDPFEFRPERFLPENKGNIPTCAFMPFGIGPRFCIAQRFALMNMKTMVGELLLNYSLTAPEGYQHLQLSRMPGLLRLKDDTLKIVLEELH